MASHRKPRTRPLMSVGLSTPAVGITTAALTSVALLSQTAQAAPERPARKPTLEEVQKKVDGLYHQAEVATQKYNGAKERTDSKKKQVDKLLDDIAERTQKMNAVREQLGQFAAAQYRDGGIGDTARMFLTDNPEDYFTQSHQMSRMTDRQQKVVDDYRTEQRATARKRVEAQKELTQLTSAQTELKKSKQAVQAKLADARDLLSKLTAEEKARLAEIKRKQEEEARKKAAELAQKQKEAEEAAARQKAQQDQQSGSGTSGSGTSSGSTGSSTSSSYATQAAKALAFAKAQIGKPYVWGATGPDSYDCSGLTQAAWKAAGISLPRTTWDQVKVGKTVPLSDIQPGDLVFFYDDISHVGLYLGNGIMIHAPKPGAYVREESIYYGGAGIIHSVVRPA
ncbi:C40 family peptidase [Streptomyces beihaiensis]|uniref:NlpC/P60 family protein n=1 Tax=Streptomyces beihaiensis TaxID=2984495 RepID=A0ABT3TMT0_9ACTN|nr:C40 family peptidase [Streptomyces beihaiensis]MCX3058357.1 NlpC/P60 family protein [Streptomyces beihaiensis]